MSGGAALRWIVPVALGAAAVTWVGASELAAPARVLTAVLVGLLPPLLLAQASVAAEEFRSLSRVPVYVSSMVFIWLLGVAALWAGRASGFGSEEMGLVPMGAAPLLAWTGALTLAALALVVLVRALRWRESPMVEWLLPKSGRERLLFVALSLSAGIGEELAFRAFLIPALRMATGSTAMAVIVSSAAFGLMHSYQRVSGALRAGLLGVLLSVPVLVTGSVFPSIAAHAAFDLVAGLLLADWLLRRDDTRIGRSRR